MASLFRRLEFESYYLPKIPQAISPRFFHISDNSSERCTGFTVTVTAEDGFGNTATGTFGMATMTASDGQKMVAAVTFVRGVAVTTVTLITPDTLTLTVMGGTLQGTSRSIVVNGGPATTFTVTAPVSGIAGMGLNVTIVAKDRFGNTVTGYSGNVTLTSSNGQTVNLSSPPAFTSGIASAAVTLNSAGMVTLTATAGTIRGTSGIITIYATGNDWFSQNMSDAALQVLARTDYMRDGSLTYSDMLGLFAQAESAGPLTSAELQSLQALITTSGAANVNMAGSVKNLTYKVIDGDPANANFQGATLGYLQVGSSAALLRNLVAKWFLGADHPAIDMEYLSGTVTYALASGTLFGSGGPTYKDVYQGEEGDCWLLASFGVTAADDPSIIQSMFTDDGTVLENGAHVHVWTVRFYDAGVASYITVDNYFPAENGRFTYADFGQSVSSSSNILWVALAEKAYAQLCESGWNLRPQSNAYASLCGGWAATALPVITGHQESNADTYASASSFISAISANMLLTLGSYADNPSLGIVGDHDYGVLGYRASDQTFTLLNPWGWNNTEAPGILHLTFDELTQNFGLDGNCIAARGALSGLWPTTSPASGLPQTGWGASASIVSPIPTGHQPAPFSQPVACETDFADINPSGQPQDEAWLDYAPAISRADLGQFLADSLTENLAWFRIMRD